MRAQTLEQVIRFFDPREPLTGQLLRAWFVPREGSPRRRLKISLTVRINEPQKILLVGHRGSGKSTELNKLAEEIADRFGVIGFNVLDVTGRTNLEYEDLMLAISTQVTQDCIDKHLIGRPLSDPVRSGWEAVRDWWRRIVTGLEFQPPAADAEIGVQLNMLLGQVEVGARQSSLTREALKEQINRHMPELIRSLNWVIAEAERSGGKRLVIVVEGLDKVDLDTAITIFRDHAPTIIAPRADMIYTFPLALRHSDHYNTIRLSFPEVCYLPNITTRHGDGTPDADGAAMLRRLVLARMDEALIEPAALDLLVAANGGIPVWLVFLMRAAALYALERSDAATQITVRDAENAIRELRREVLVPLTRHDRGVLRARHRDRRLSNDADEQRLLYNGSLIDYSNGEPWCDAHPVLWPLLERDDENADEESA
jgi:energy-coupling factor transporter ATP-binding protein EcfA2